MPRIESNTPEHLRPYIFHGVDLQWRDGAGEATGDCPFCGRESKFSIRIETGLWKCFGCAAGTDKGGGNTLVFLRCLWDQGRGLTTNCSDLASNRRLVHQNTLEAWGVVWSPVTGEWLIPGYNSDGEVNQLYRYAKHPVSGQMRLLATPGLPHQLCGSTLYDPTNPNVFVAEGPWDGMTLWEVLETDDLSKEKAATVIAVPGCNVFAEAWLSLLAGKNVTLLYDNDHPRKHPKTGQEVEPAALGGMRRVAGLLATATPPPLSIKYIKWGKDGYDLERPHGYDVRDMLSGLAPRPPNPMPVRVKLLDSLLGMVEPIPDEWIGGRTAVSLAEGGAELACLPCQEWKELTLVWRKAVKWIEGLDRALSVMLACIVSTRAVGDQLWCKIIGPAACGKSTLCEALSVNKKYVLAKSTIRGFHSGFQADRSGKEDNSLLALLKNKTLVTKDGDTLLQSPNLGQILSEARDVYDRVSRTHYRNRASRDYEGHSLTWLLCGTESLRALDSSELGERFLDCIIVEHIDEDEEAEIGWRVANRAEREMSYISDGRADSRDSPEMVHAKQLTGGYVQYICDNAHALLDGVRAPEWALRKCQKLATFVAYMRARPSIKQEEKAQREMAFRLISQHVRLAKSLAAVLNRDQIDEEVMRRVRQVALDTARGRTLEIARHLYQAGTEGAEVVALANWTNETEDKERKLLHFLRKIGAVESFTAQKVRGLPTRPRWRLTKRLRKLYHEAVEVTVGANRDGD